MNEAAYLGAAHPEPVRCLGQQLEPYSLVHDMLLRQNRNFFILPTAEFDKLNPTADQIIAQLFIGAYICRHAYPEVKAALARPDLKKIATKWRRQQAKVDEAAEVRLFRKYCLAAQYCPEFEAIKRRGRRRYEPRSPWLLILFRTLVEHLHFSRAEAFNCPLAEAQMLYLSHWESEGTIRILTDEEARVRAEKRRREAEQNDNDVHKAAAALGLKVIRYTDVKICEEQPAEEPVDQDVEAAREALLGGRE